MLCARESMDSAISWIPLASWLVCSVIGGLPIRVLGVDHVGHRVVPCPLLIGQVRLGWPVGGLGEVRPVVQSGVFLGVRVAVLTGAHGSIAETMLVMTPAAMMTSAAMPVTV